MAAPPEAARRPTPNRTARPRTRRSSSRPSDGTARPWKMFQISSRSCTDRNVHCPACTDFLTGYRLTSPTSSTRCSTRAGELKAAPLLERARGAHRRADLPAPSTRTRISFEVGHLRARRTPDGAAQRRDAAVARRVGRATPRSSSPATSRRSGSAPAPTSWSRAGALRDRAGDQHAHRAAPPVSGARRPADAEGDVRRARRPPARLRRRRQQCRPVTSDRSAASRASRCGSRRRPATSSSRSRAPC